VRSRNKLILDLRIEDVIWVEGERVKCIIGEERNWKVGSEGEDLRVRKGQLGSYCLKSTSIVSISRIISKTRLKESRKSS